MTPPSNEPPSERGQMHASAVAFRGAGMLILGASGSGKSSLALELMSRGADLVADDQVTYWPHEEGGGLWIAPHARIAGRIEARGVGILEVPVVAPVLLRWVVTLDETEAARLPEAHETVIAGLRFPLLRKVESPAFPAMLSALALGGRSAP